MAKPDSSSTRSISSMGASEEFPLRTAGRMETNMIGARSPSKDSVPEHLGLARLTRAVRRISPGMGWEPVTRASPGSCWIVLDRVGLLVIYVAGQM